MNNFINDITNINVLIGFFSGLFGLLISIVGLAKYILKKVNQVLEQKVKQPILNEVKKNREEYMEELNKHIIQDYKTYLVDFLTRAENGEPIAKNQMKNAYDMKDEYKQRGGDSYVDEKWDELEEKGIIKDLRKKERKKNNE